VWKDLNGNGVQDPGEPGISGVTVELRDCNNNVVQSTTTDTNGNYNFTVPEGGQYQVKFQNPVGYVFSPSSQGGDIAKDSNPDSAGVVACATYLTSDDKIDAGLIPLITIGDYVWNDLNGNGVQESGEPGIPGVTVKLRNCVTSDVTTTTTGPLGQYSFTVPAGGQYEVTFMNPSGYVFSPTSAGTPETDSNPNPATGIVTCATYLHHRRRPLRAADHDW
jgi:hypothetical protein